MWPWIAGSEVFTSRPQTVVLPDYPAVNEDREVAAAELDRLAPLGKILLYSDGSRPPHLSVCPSRLIIKEDKGRVGRDWSNHQYPLNSVLANPPSQYGTMDEFSQLLSPGPFMSGGDLQGCFFTGMAGVMPRAGDFPVCATQYPVPCGRICSCRLALTPCPRGTIIA